MPSLYTKRSQTTREAVKCAAITNITPPNRIAGHPLEKEPHHLKTAAGIDLTSLRQTQTTKEKWQVNIGHFRGWPIGRPRFSASPNPLPRSSSKFSSLRASHRRATQARCLANSESILYTPENFCRASRSVAVLPVTADRPGHRKRCSQVITARQTQLHLSLTSRPDKINRVDQDRTTPLAKCLESPSNSTCSSSNPSAVTAEPGIKSRDWAGIKRGIFSNPSRHSRAWASVA